MGKKLSNRIKLIKRPQQYPISKSKTFLGNFNAYINILNRNFNDLPVKIYIKHVHQYIEKIKKRLKPKILSQKQLVSARNSIKVCKICQGWSNDISTIQCSRCQDYYHKKCLENSCPITEQQKQWHCESCYQHSNVQNNKQQSLKEINKLKKCQSCKKNKTKHQLFLNCTKCKKNYHKNCHGTYAVCIKCHRAIQKQLKQNIKQTNLLDFQFKKRIERNKVKKIQTTQKNGDLKIFEKQQLIDENTQMEISINEDQHFSKGFPKMTSQQIKGFKQNLIYAIKAKGMTHTQQLFPIDCSLQYNNQQSLDFGLMRMNHNQQSTYKNYKAQPFGPFKLVFAYNMGYDVIADKDLPKGMLVCQYIGQVVTYREVIQSNELNPNDSLFDLKSGKNADQTLCIRPQIYTNIGRFINGVNNLTGTHKINVAAIRLIVKNRPGVFIYTTKQIKKGQSLALNYNGGCINTYPTQNFM